MKNKCLLNMKCLIVIFIFISHASNVMTESITEATSTGETSKEEIICYKCMELTGNGYGWSNNVGTCTDPASITKMMKTVPVPDEKLDGVDEDAYKKKLTGKKVCKFGCGTFFFTETIGNLTFGITYRDCATAKSQTMNKKCAMNKWQETFTINFNAAFDICYTYYNTKTDLFVKIDANFNLCMQILMPGKISQTNAPDEKTTAGVGRSSVAAMTTKGKKLVGCSCYCLLPECNTQTSEQMYNEYQKRSGNRLGGATALSQLKSLTVLFLLAGSVVQMVATSSHF